MDIWNWIAAALALWFIIAVAVGLAVGATIRKRDRTNPTTHATPQRDATRATVTRPGDDYLAWLEQQMQKDV